LSVDGSSPEEIIISDDSGSDSESSVDGESPAPKKAKARHQKTAEESGFKRVNVMRYLLTWPQVGPDLNGRELAQFLRTRRRKETDPIPKVKLARERHKDGGWHFHAYVDFGKAFSTRDCRYFDFEGHHCNIEKVTRTPRIAYEYPGNPDKDDAEFSEIICDDFPPDYLINDTKKESKDQVFGRMIDEAESKDQFLENMKNYAAKTLVTSFNNVHAFANYWFKPKAHSYVTPSALRIDWTIYPQILEWYKDNVLNRGPR
jgi:hypothetical protein